jgi:hypothetical protein
MSQRSGYYYPPQPAKTDHTLIIVLVVVVVAVIVIAGVVATAFLSASIFRASSSTGGGGNTPQPVSITATNYQIDYTSGGSYFGPSSQSNSQTFDTTTGSEFTDTLKLTNNDLFTAHSVNSVTITTPGFTLVSTSPYLPYSVGSSGSVSITLTITAPTTQYNGPLGILVSTS